MLVLIPHQTYSANLFDHSKFVRYQLEKHLPQLARQSSS
ncbi:hypothetical protein D041_0620A, partial [Vibrio parahaemolyticus EKP-008]